jgi:penicillin-binding protein 1C
MDMRLRRGIAALLLAAGLGWLVIVGVASSRCRLLQPIPTVQLLDRHGAFLGEVGGEGERLGFWPVQSLPERVVLATLALEDRRFGQHPGVDLLAVARALRQNVGQAERVSGASTLAMQVARLQDPGPRTWTRKLVEAVTALLLVERYGREELLRQYLVLAPYGNNVYGIGYAARRYFDKPVEDLSWAETALLAAVPQAPGRRDLTTAAGRAEAGLRARRILDQLLADGVIDEQTQLVAVRELGSTVQPQRKVRPASTLHPVLAWEQRPAWPGQPTTVYTSLDLELQGDVQAILHGAVAAWEDEGAGNAAAVVVDLDTLQVLADVGSTGWHNAAHSGAIDFSRVKRYPGSTLKPFVYALAIDRGLVDPGTVLDDLSRGPDGIGNADGDFLGPLLPRVALANSRNVPAVELTRRLGLDETWALLARLGLHDDSLPASHFGLSLSIGGMPTSPLQLARAWTTLATDGQLRELQWTRDSARPEGQPIFSPEVARWTALALSDPMARLPTFPRMGQSELSFPAAFKTGTSADHRDAWTVAFSRRYLVVVWVGHPDWRPMQGLSGYRAASLLARRILVRLHPEGAQGLEDTSFPRPERWVSAQVCPLSGQRAGPRCSGTFHEVFPPERAPVSECTVHVDQRGHVAVRLPPRYAGWLSRAGLPAAEPWPAEPGEISLELLSPAQGAQLTRDPDLPPEQSTLRLAVSVAPPVEQVLWLVDGRPFALVGPPYEVRWPLTPGEHTFQAQLPYRPEHTETVHIFAR